MNVILQIVAALGGFGAIGWFIAKWAGDRAAERLKMAWQHEFDTSIERLRAELGSQTAAMEAVLQAASQTNLAAQSKRIEAVQELWSHLLTIRKKLGWRVLPYSTVTDDELNRLSQYPRLKALLDSITYYELCEELVVMCPTADQLTPFVGQQVWAIFAAYRAFMGRLALKLAEGHERGSIPPWHKQADGQEDPVIPLLRSILTKEEMTTVITTPMGCLHAQGFMESHMLSAIDDMLSGRNAARRTADERARIVGVLAKVETASAAPM